MLEILEGGGDTDTNACIVGGMIGALNGADAMPKRTLLTFVFEIIICGRLHLLLDMRDAVLQCDLTKGGQKERPDWLHPKHAPLLVTKLLQRAPDKP